MTLKCTSLAARNLTGIHRSIARLYGGYKIQLTSLEQVSVLTKLLVTVYISTALCAVINTILKQEGSLYDSHAASRIQSDTSVTLVIKHSLCNKGVVSVE